MGKQEFNQLEMGNCRHRWILVVFIITIAVNGVPAQATAAPTGTELQQDDTLKTPIAKKKLDALLPVKVTPEINDEAMVGSHESDFYDGELCTSSAK